MRVYFETYGCTLNHGESRLMAQMLQERGHELVNDIEEGDVLVLVTCTVIKTTENRMIKRLKAFTSLDRQIIVAGCMASVQSKEIKEINPKAEILPPSRLREIGDVIEKFSKDVSRQESSNTPIYKDTDAIVPIANGCLGSCTYCITRIARGSLRSYEIESITRNVENAISEGKKEIKITAQDTASYGRDIGKTLPELLEELTKIEGDFRIRVGMMNPDSALPILNDLIRVYRHEKIFKFLHLPLQSGDDDILRKMGRHYTVEDFKKIVRAFRNALPELTLSTDIIVGFPSEDEGKFLRSYECLKELEPDIVNITRFSPRPNTPAFNMKKVHGRKVKEWSRRLTKLRFELSKRNLENYIGKEMRILTTEFGKDGAVIGRTDSYKTVVLKDKIDLGKFFKVRIVDASPIYLVGHL